MDISAASSHSNAYRELLSNLEFRAAWHPSENSPQRPFIECCKFTFDSKSLIFGASDGFIRILNLENSALIEIRTGGEIIWGLDVSTDNEYACCCTDDKMVRVFSLVSMTFFTEHSFHSDNVWDVKFTKDCRHVISCSSDLRIIIWDFKAKTEYYVIPNCHTNFVVSMALSNNGGMLASCSYDQSIRIWVDLDHILDKDIECQAILKGHRNRVTCCAFSPQRDDILVSGSADCDLILWSISHQNILRRFKGHSNIIWSCAFLRLKNVLVLISCSSDHSLRFWDTYSGTDLNKIDNLSTSEDAPAQLLSCQVSNNKDRIAVTTTDGCILYAFMNI